MRPGEEKPILSAARASHVAGFARLSGGLAPTARSVSLVMEKTTATILGSDASRRLLVLNLVGGGLVLLSYGIVPAVMEGAEVAELWGGVTEDLRPPYIACMVAATLGYFPMLAFYLRHYPRKPSSGSPAFGEETVLALFTAVLFPSAAFVPLTAVFVERPAALLWWSIRALLLVVGMASAGLLAGIVRCRGRAPRASRRWALVGSAIFTFQTLFLDALVWPALVGSEYDL